MSGRRERTPPPFLGRFAEAGLLFIAAAGNSGTDNDFQPHYPSNYEVDACDARHTPHWPRKTLVGPIGMSLAPGRGAYPQPRHADLPDIGPKPPEKHLARRRAELGQIRRPEALRRCRPLFWAGSTKSEVTSTKFARNGQTLHVVDELWSDAR